MALGLGLATLGAGILGAGASAFGAGASAAASAAAVKKQIAWERERAQNAHQWEVQDLQKAGLNPILSAGGQGATTGGISAPVPDTSGYQNTANIIAGTIQAIAQNNLTNATAKNMIQDTSVKKEQTNLLAQQTLNEAVKNGLISAQKAGIEFDNLKKQYEWEKRDLIFWNDFINRASGTARNAAEAISLPQLMRLLRPENARKLTPEKLEKLLYKAYK